MASPTLITIVVAIITQAYCEYPKSGVVYVPVCSPDCYKQSHFTGCPEKVHIGNLPLQEHSQTYHPHLDLGSQRLQQGQHGYRGQEEEQGYHGQVEEQGYHGQVEQQVYHGKVEQQGYHGQVEQQGYHGQVEHGSARVYQQKDHHSSEHKQSIHHHGSGTSQQSFRQEYHGLASHDDDQGHGHDHEHDHHKKNAYYKFEYSVNDHKTGDVKLHKEEKKGDVVNGEYSLLEEDGNVRTVKYYADWKSGFHAQVHNTKPKHAG